MASDGAALTATAKRTALSVAGSDTGAMARAGAFLVGAVSYPDRSHPAPEFVTLSLAANHDRAFDRAREGSSGCCSTAARTVDTSVVRVRGGGTVEMSAVLFLQPPETGR